MFSASVSQGIASCRMNIDVDSDDKQALRAFLQNRNVAPEVIQKMEEDKVNYIFNYTSVVLLDNSDIQV